MKTYIKSSNDGDAIIIALAKRIADGFNKDIKEGGFDGWEHYVMSMGLTSADLKDEIVSFADYLWGKDHEQHKAHYYVEDNGTICSGDIEYSYRKFKNLIMKYVIHDSDNNFDDEE